MKEEFSGHFRPTEQEFEKLWQNALIVLDASMLLNFYRYSAETREEVLRMLRSFENRLWLPHRAAEEFFKNRIKVISDQKAKYDDAIKAIEKTNGELQNIRQHPFLSPELLAEWTNLHQLMRAELSTTRDNHQTLLTNDTILLELAQLFEGRVGPPFSSEDTEEICREGQRRYEKRIPPGYKDASKDDADDPSRRYGDLILWKQVLAKAAADRKPVILLLDDSKEDWWVCPDRRTTVGPRPELIQEMRTFAGEACYLYQPDAFLAYAKTYGKQTISEPAITEVRDVQEAGRQREESSDRRLLAKERLQQLERERNVVVTRMNSASAELSELFDRYNRIGTQAVIGDLADGAEQHWPEVARLRAEIETLNVERNQLAVTNNALSQRIRETLFELTSIE